MTRQQLRVELSWFCGCGNPEDAALSLLKILNLHPLYDHQDEIDRLIPDNGVRHLVLYHLSELGLTEHGGSVGGGWLTPKGEAVRDALEKEQEADPTLESLFEEHCIHGFDVGDPQHDCMAAGDPVGWTSADRSV